MEQRRNVEPRREVGRDVEPRRNVEPRRDRGIRLDRDTAYCR